MSPLDPSDEGAGTGRTFFPRLISASFQRGLRLAFDFAAGSAVLAGVVSWTRGTRYIHAEHDVLDDVAFGMHEVGEMAAGEVGAGISSSDDSID